MHVLSCLGLHLPLTIAKRFIVLSGCVASTGMIFTSDTQEAPSPTANPATCQDEFGSVRCVNGCRSLWYRVVGTGNEIFASTCDPSTVFDSKIMVYRGSCSSGLECVTSNNKGCGSGRLGTTTWLYRGSSVSWPSVKGTEYFIQVTGVAPGPHMGTFKLHVDGGTEQGLYTCEFLHSFSRTSCLSFFLL
jgi:hypothetical protein